MAFSIPKEVLSSLGSDRTEIARNGPSKDITYRRRKKNSSKTIYLPYWKMFYLILANIVQSSGYLSKARQPITLEAVYLCPKLSSKKEPRINFTHTLMMAIKNLPLRHKINSSLRTILRKYWRYSVTDSEIHKGQFISYTNTLASSL